MIFPKIIPSIKLSKTSVAKTTSKKDTYIGNMKIEISIIKFEIILIILYFLYRKHKLLFIS